MIRIVHYIKDLIKCIVKLFSLILFTYNFALNNAFTIVSFQLYCNYLDFLQYQGQVALSLPQYFLSSPLVH